MSTQITPPITIRTSGGQERSFTTTEDLQAFALAERDFWQFLSEKTKSGRPLAREARWPLDRLGNVIGTLSDFEAGRTPIDELRNQVSATYSNERDKIPTSDGRDAQAVKVFAEELPDDAFLAAATTILRRWGGQAGAPAMNNEAQWMGFIAATNYRVGHSATTAAATDRALNELLGKFSGLLQSSESQLDQQANELSGALTKFAERASSQIEEANTAADASVKTQEFAAAKMISDKAQELDAAKNRVEELERTFREKLHLEAPTEYWTAKRKRHKTFALGWGIAAGVWAALATVGMLIGLHFELEAVSKLTNDTPIAVYLVHAARGLLLSVVVFWVARLLVRLCLSELHLGMDAYERTTMVLTYLALAMDGKVDDKERALVLQSLFRPTADGLVKDDASVDGNLAAFLGRLGQQK